MGLRNRSTLDHEQCFFVTTTCYKWLKLLDSITAINIIAGSLDFLTEKYKCCLSGYVIMPNHIHLILYFPEQNRLSDFMRDLKKFTSVKLRQEIDKPENEHLINTLRHEIREQKFKIWMDRFDDVVITNADMLRTKLNYIHNNPLQQHWDLASIPEEYPYSSAAFYDGSDNGLVKLTNYSDFIW